MNLRSKGLKFTDFLKIWYKYSFLQSIEHIRVPKQSNNVLPLFWTPLPKFLGPQGA